MILEKSVSQKSRFLIKLLLIFSLVLSCVPLMGVTSYADDDEPDFAVGGECSNSCMWVYYESKGLMQIVPRHSYDTEGLIQAGDGIPWRGRSLSELDITFKVEFTPGGSNIGGAINEFIHLDFPVNAVIKGLENLDTKNITSMESMFAGFTNLTVLDISNFATPKVTDFSKAFAGCTNLESLDISGFDTSLNPKIDGMLEGCTSLKQIKVGEKFASGGQFPKGCWRDDAGYLYTESEIPDFKAATYNYYGPVKPEVDMSKAVISLSKSDFVYSGKEQLPAIGVTLGGKALSQGSDYAVAAFSNKEIGTASVTVTGMVPYLGAKTVTFSISPKGTKLAKVKGVKKGLIIKWKKLTSKYLKQITGYKIRYAKTKSMKAAKTKTVKVKSNAGKKRTLKVTKLKSKKRYYVQVATYKKVGGKTYVSTWSKAKKVKTK